jgi:hypothetical protein
MPQQSASNVTYFKPDKLIFRLTGNVHREAGAQERIAGLLEWANERSKEQGKGIQLAASEKIFGFDAVEVSVQFPEPPPKEGVSYKSPPAKPQPPFSLVFIDVLNPNWPQSLPGPGEEETPEEREIKMQALEDLFDLAILLDNPQTDVPGGLEGVSLNWLMGGSASSPGSTGGPGIRPTPYEGLSNTEEYRFSDVPLIREQSVDGRLDEPGMEVVVAILDTVPAFQEDDEVLATIYRQWVEGKADKEKHSLLKTLLGSEGKLKKVYFDDDVDQPVPGVWPDGYIQVEDHDYLMTDHGLFVAGIIHSIAPQAELHLFQVLNRYGVGDLLSITQALEKIRDDDETFPKDRLLVNLSLTINLPLEEGQGKQDRLTDRILAQIRKDKEWAESEVESINRICAGFYAQGGKVIAAAGNNAEIGRGRPQACYPAAFENVLGVGALPKTEKPENARAKVKAASYSNRSDRPARTGIATLGGEAEEKKGDKKGLLGIYLGEFPPSKNRAGREQISNGWGWWGGTSFAAPIITGMVAAVRGFIPGLPTMESALQELFGVQRYETEDFDEDVFLVTQGSSSS